MMRAARKAVLPMSGNDVKARLYELYDIIEKHNYNYYVLDDPTVEDDEYDALMREVKAIEAEHPELVTDYSPTRRVGGTALSTFEKVTLSIPQCAGKSSLNTPWSRRSTAFRYRSNTVTEFWCAALLAVTGLWVKT